MVKETYLTDGFRSVLGSDQVRRSGKPLLYILPDRVRRAGFFFAQREGTVKHTGVVWRIAGDERLDGLEIL